MKKLWLFFLLMCSAVTHAYDYPYLVFQTSNGELTTVSVESLTMSVSDENLQVTNIDGDTSFPILALSKMYFDSETTAMPQVQGCFSEKVVVFSVVGTQMGVFSSEAEALDALPRGVYIIKSNSGIIKKILK
ncbi:MAG: hypothetical protein E7076_06435 [Bacteroidales bacterium]|nr:hypothetical protein [Bacteroidales bacterium]